MCTDKNGTLTQSRMQAAGVWTAAGFGTADDDGLVSWPAVGTGKKAVALAHTLLATAA